METNARKVESGKAEMKLAVLWGDIEKSYKENLLKYQKDIAFPGFRKGKVPMNIMESKIGEELLQNVAVGEIDKVLRAAIEKVEPELRPLPYCRPAIQDEDKMFPVKKGADIDFTVTYDISPDVGLKEYKGLKIEYPNVRISDEMVNAEIERLRERNSTVEKKNDGAVEKDDIVTVDYVNLDSENESDKVDGYTCTVGMYQSMYGFDDDILGMKEGETREFVKDMTGKQKPAGFTADSARLKVTVKSIKVKKLPELDDEFAQDVKSEYKTVDDLKKGVRADLEKNLEDRMKETKISLIIDKILEDAEINVPESMLNYEIETSYRRIIGQMGATVETFEKYLKSLGQTKESFVAGWKDEALRKLKGQLVIDEVRKREGLKGDEEKIQSIMKEKVPAEAQKDEIEHFEGIVRDNMAHQAAIDFLISENKLKPGKEEVTYEDFASGKYLEKKGKSAKDEKTAEKAGSEEK